MVRFEKGDAGTNSSVIGEVMDVDAREMENETKYGQLTSYCWIFMWEDE